MKKIKILQTAFIALAGFISLNAKGSQQFPNILHIHAEVKNLYNR